MATKKAIKNRYEITTAKEMREAKWLIEQGFFSDMVDYLERSAEMELKKKESGKIISPKVQKQDKAA